MRQKCPTQTHRHTQTQIITCGVGLRKGRDSLKLCKPLLPYPVHVCVCLFVCDTLFECQSADFPFGMMDRRMPCTPLTHSLGGVQGEERWRQRRVLLLRLTHSTFPYGRHLPPGPWHCANGKEKPHNVYTLARATYSDFSCPLRPLATR